MMKGRQAARQAAASGSVAVLPLAALPVADPLSAWLATGVPG
jgi:hypothetical protein